MNVQSLLNYINRFVQLTDDEEAFLLSKVTYRKYLKGQFLLQQGDICKYSNYLISGCCKIFFTDNKGQEHVIMFAIEDWWASDIGSFITQMPADYNIQCLEPTEVIQFYHSNQDEILDRVPKLNTMFKKMLENALVSSQKRIVRSFSLTAKEQYLEFKKQYPTIEERVPQYLIASYLGVTKEFLSTIKGQIATDRSLDSQ